ncbi:hypothetical protein A2159_02945 [Candidatus Woesebacteria bacterium RBG_13_34_9]|uniref:Glycosyl transferase family 1 domain-containing protein n=1 Tax=Candidatus Woesebacteria bacterium RBG_13_34_9 TaxID=1802477 RepID=A0A1F7X4P3_9BACT|nr:MAG: hypothetical protein A2159_02945 [Candidatus Woesebacteria bacterium RBG_13_34_9]
MNKLNIALVTQSLDTKSGSRAPVELAKALSKNHKITIFAAGGSLSVKKNLERQGLKVIFLNPIQLFINILIGRFGAISFHGTFPYFVASRLTNVPILCTYYGTQFDAYLERSFGNNSNLNRALNKLVNLIIYTKTKLILSLSTKRTSISKFTKSEARRLYGSLSDLIYLSGASNLVYSQKKDLIFTILAVSRFTPYKGFDGIINAFNKLKKTNTRLVIAGSSQNRRYLELLQKKSNKQIKIIRNPSDQILSKLYSKASCFVSFDRYLFFGMPICEAETFSLPILAYNAAAAGELVEHGKNGYLFISETELTKYLNLLITKPKLRLRLGKQAFIKSQNYTWKITAKNYEKLLFKLIRKNG